MQRRVLLGLALFACLMASGWAWQRLASSASANGYEGTYVRITVTEERDALCADMSESVPEGIMRVRAESIAFLGGTCAIVQVREISEDRSEGVAVTAELGLDCNAGGAGPDGLDATLWITSRANLTSYVAMDDGDYTEAHATFLRCAPGARN